MRRAGVIAVMAVVVAAPPAVATTLPEMTYSPPVLTVRDYKAHNSVENVVAARSGSHIAVTNSPAPMALDPASDPGCEGVIGGYRCPVAGIDRLVILLGNLDDTAEVTLGPLARKVPSQIVRGGEGEDRAAGGAGRQVLKGGPGDDLLKGGKGPDALVGGPGDDTCRGGPGKDVVKSC